MLQKLLLSLVGTFLAFLLMECAVRVFIKTPETIRLINSSNVKESSYEPSANPILGYVLKKSERNSKADCHNTFLYTNSFGFRDIERSLEKPEGTYRILFLGDSVVAGHGECDLEKTIPSILNKKINDPKIEVLNMGVGGYCTRAEVELLVEHGLQFKPDHVFLLFVGNDFVNSNSELTHRLRYQRPKITESLFQNSSLFRLLALKTDLFSYRAQYEPSYQLTIESSKNLRNNVEEGLTLLSELSKLHKFNVTIFTWPYFTDKDVLPAELLLPNYESLKIDRLETIVERLNLTLIRLEPYFEADSKERRTNYKGAFKHFSPRWAYSTGDGVHPSVLGAEIAGSTIFSHIKVRIPTPSSNG